MLGEIKNIELNLPTHFSRDNPSDRYKTLQEQYQYMHQDPEMFAGISLPRQADRIADLLKQYRCCSLLDYGCGKGQQYKGEMGERILDLWGQPKLYLYDPAVSTLSKLPADSVDAVICTDVLEHCPQEDLWWIVSELFSLANKAVFANIASYPARKCLPNGENAHTTQQPAAWWAKLFLRISRLYPAVNGRIYVEASDGQEIAFKF